MLPRVRPSVVLWVLLSELLSEVLREELTVALASTPQNPPETLADAATVADSDFDVARVLSIEDVSVDESVYVWLCCCVFPSLDPCVDPSEIPFEYVKPEHCWVSLPPVVID